MYWLHEVHCHVYALHNASKAGEDQGMVEENERGLAGLCMLPLKISKADEMPIVFLQRGYGWLILL